MSVRDISALLPYAAIWLGMHVFHSAWAAILLFHAVILLIIAVSRTKPPLKELVRSSGNRWLFVSVIIGTCSGIALFLLWPLLSVPADIGTYLNGIGLTAYSWPFFIIYYVLMNPFIEEYYWRGWMGSGSKRPVLTDALFGGYHVIVLAPNIGIAWLIPVFVLLSGAGWYWRQTRRVTAGLLTPILSHMAADITIILTICHFS